MQTNAIGHGASFILHNGPRIFLEKGQSISLSASPYQWKKQGNNRNFHESNFQMHSFRSETGAVMNYLDAKRLIDKDPIDFAYLNLDVETKASLDDQAQKMIGSKKYFITNVRRVSVVKPLSDVRRLPNGTETPGEEATLYGGMFANPKADDGGVVISFGGLELQT